MSIYFFAASLIFLIAVARKKKIRALSPYGIFVAFQTLYNIMPWLTSYLGLGVGFFSLLSDKHIVTIQLVLAAVANLCFGLVHLAFARNVKFSEPRVLSSQKSRRNYLCLVIPFFIVTSVLCHFYGWHQLTFSGLGADGIGGMFIVTAYFKFFFVAIYLYYIYRFGLDKGAWILIGEHLIVMGIDGARSTFLPILLVTLFIFLDKVTDEKRIKRIYAIAVAGIALSIGARALMLHADSLLGDMVIPITVEGALGAYPSLQSIQGVENLDQHQYTLGASYLLDPIIWLIPRSVGRDGLSSLDNWSTSLTNVLDENFAPMGGFYYLSEAVAAYSYAGPVIITTIFAAFLVWVERNKNRYRMLYLAWMPTIGILFIKTQFGNVFKLFLIQFICIYLLFISRKAKAFLASTQRKINTI